MSGSLSVRMSGCQVISVSGCKCVNVNNSSRFHSHEQRPPHIHCNISLINIL